MDEDTPPIGNGNAADNHPMRRRDGEDSRAVPWTPEDASRFLSTAIHEAQKPLADALKQRPATTSTLILIVGILILAGAAVGWILFHQLTKSESGAASARAARDSALVEQYELRAKTETLEARLSAAQSERERLNREYLEETESLRGQAEGKRDREEELRRAQIELTRFRRQNELLKNQISGLEMEKLALSRQLEAVKAMAIDEDFDAFGTEEEPRASSPSPDLPPSPEATPETPTSQTEPPLEEAPVLEAAGTGPAAPATGEGSADRIAISSTETHPFTDGTVTVEEVPETDGATGTLTLGPDGQNPPTLYESISMSDAAKEASAALPVQITPAIAPVSESEAASGETPDVEDGANPERVAEQSAPDSESEAAPASSDPEAGEEAEDPHPETGGGDESPTEPSDSEEEEPVTGATESTTPESADGGSAK